MNSRQIVFSLINQMFGELGLALPVLFNKEGYVTCIGILILQGFISFKTCSILASNMKAKEKDVSESILRILGIGWWKLFMILSSLYLFLMSLQYFLLLNNMIYRIVTFFMSINGNHSFAATTEATYSKFSLQYLAILTAIPIGTSSFIRQIDVLVYIS